jgi:Flp pilus assembly protein TadG
MVEFSIAFPVLALVALGTVDVSYLLYEWNAAGKATQMGVRKAVVVNPAAT